MELDDKHFFDSVSETQFFDRLNEIWQETLPSLRELAILKLEEYIEQGYIVKENKRTCYSYNEAGEEQVDSEKTWEIKMPVPQWMRIAVKEYRQQFPYKSR